MERDTTNDTDTVNDCIFQLTLKDTSHNEFKTPAVIVIIWLINNYISMWGMWVVFLLIQKDLGGFSSPEWQVEKYCKSWWRQTISINSVTSPFRLPSGSEQEPIHSVSNRNTMSTLEGECNALVFESHHGGVETRDKRGPQVLHLLKYKHVTRKEWKSKWTHHGIIILRAMWPSQYSCSASSYNCTRWQQQQDSSL